MVAEPRSSRWTHDDLELVAAALSASLTSDEIAQIVIDRATEVLGASSGALWLLEGDNGKLIRANGYTTAMSAHFASVRRGDATPVGSALQSGDEIFVESRAEYAERWTEREQEARVFSHVSELAFACLPLVAAERVLGALAFSFEGARHFDREERSLLRILARHCTVAVQRAELFRGESRARERITRLQRITTALAATATRADVARTLIEHAIATAGASGGGVWFVDAAGENLEHGHSSFSAEVRAEFARLPIAADLPLSEVTRTGAPIFIASMAEYRARYPALAARQPEAASFALAALPIVSRGAILAAFFVTFDEGLVLDAEERGFLGALADQASIAFERARLIDDLARERQLLATILDQQPAAVVTVDTTERVVLANRRSHEILGSPPRTLGEYEAGQLANGEAVAPDQLPLSRALRGERVSDFLVRTHIGDHNRILRVGAGPVRDNEGTVVAAVATFSDVTDERLAETKLREEVATNQSLHRIASALSAELDLDRLLQRLTDEATNLVGAQFGSYFYNVLNDKGESYMLWTLSGVPREAFSRFPMPRNTAIFAPTFRGEGVVRFDDVTKAPEYGHSPPHYGMPKRHLPVRSYLAAPVLSRSGEVLGGLFFGHADPGVFDERDEIAIATVAAQAAISIDNARLYRDEQHARERAEEALRVREAFLSVASHELKTPVTAVSLQLQMLRREVERGDLDLARAAKKLLSAERGIRKLTALVDELLDVSRLGAGRLEVRNEPVDVAELVVDVVSRFEALASDAGTRVSMAVGPALALGDAQRVDQVISNLLSNAIKYGRGNPVEVSCQQDDKLVIVTVHDEGIGIAEESRGRIFGRFERAVDERSFGGIGLGLWISKSLIEAMGGDITVESELGRGSTFVARLPRAP